MDHYQDFISKKAEKKRAFMGKMFFPRKPILLFDFSDAKKIAQYKDLLEGLNSIDLTTLVLAPENAAAMPEGKNLRYINKDDKENAYTAADFVLVFDNTKIVKALSTGCVPISQQDGDSTVNYNPLQEKGNGFYFKNPTKWELFAAIMRALETYQFPYDWENLVREILKSRN